MRAGDDDYFGRRMVKDVDHAVGRFVEVDRDSDAAGAGDGKVGSVPFGSVGGEDGDAVAGFNAEFDEGHGQACDTPKEFSRGDGVPGIVATEQLRARIRQGI